MIDHRVVVTAPSNHGVDAVANMVWDQFATETTSKRFLGLEAASIEFYNTIPVDQRGFSSIADTDRSAKPKMMESIGFGDNPNYIHAMCKTVTEFQDKAVEIDKFNAQTGKLKSDYDTYLRTKKIILFP